MPGHAAASSSVPAAKDSHAADEHAPSPARKLTDEELKACADRLSHPIRHAVEELPPLVPRKVLPKSEIAHSVSKLYDQSISRKKQLLDEINKKREAEMLKPKVLPATDLEGTFDRLYSQQMELKRKNEQRLKEEQLAAHRSRKLNKDEQLESAKRLCDASIEKAREAHRGLWEKYVLSTEPAAKRLTREELNASAARLCRKE